MFQYRNTSLAMKSFYGVTFQPGGTNEVPGYINDPAMIRVNALTPTHKVSVKKSPIAAEKEQPKQSIKQEKEKQGGQVNGSDHD